MNRIGLIIAREYLTRIKKKTFLIMTLLTPLLIAAVIVVPVWLTQSMKDESVKTIMVIDDSDLYENVLKTKGNVQFIEIQQDIEEAKNQLQDFYAILHIKKDLSQHPDAIDLYSEKQVNLDIQNSISRELREHIRQKKLENYADINIKSVLKDLETHVKITAIKMGKDGTQKRSSTELAMGIALFAGLLIYMFIFLYGAQVMRGVIEEKTSRIIEVIISSVKPFQLMMGKIIGVAMVGLTQFLLWVILTISILFVLQAFFLPEEVKQKLIADRTEQVSELSGTVPKLSKDQEKMVSSLELIESINFKEIITYFILYFLGGYLLYSALFAAVGAAVDNETDTQQFMLPITLPMIFALYVGMSAINNPHGPIAFWCSIIPFTSPIVMLVRIPFDVPLWEKLLSLFLLACTFIFVTYGASKVYRVGILMYGKKINYKELWKWIRY